MVSIELLKNLIPFITLSTKSLHAIADRAFERKFPAGVSILIEGVPAEYCYFLLSGQVRVFRMNLDGRQQILARLTAGAPLNVISLLKEEGLNLASIETISPVNVIVLDAESFETLLGSCPDFARMLLKIFAKRISQMTDLAANLSLYTVRARLARFLIEIADQPQLQGGWTQDEIAAQIGTVRDVVGRLLRQFEDEGLITRDRQKVNLLDRSQLSQEAEQREV